MPVRTYGMDRARFGSEHRSVTVNSVAAPAPRAGGDYTSHALAQRHLLSRQTRHGPFTSKQDVVPDAGAFEVAGFEDIARPDLAHREARIG